MGWVLIASGSKTSRIFYNCLFKPLLTVVLQGAGYGESPHQRPPAAEAAAGERLRGHEQEAAARVGGAGARHCVQ